MRGLRPSVTSAARRRWAAVEGRLADVGITVSGLTDPTTVAPAVASFDLYDTLVVRRSVTEVAVHRHVAERARAAGTLGEAVTPETYVATRRAAADELGRHTDAASLDAIHDRLASMLDLDEARSRQLRRLETAFELDDIVPVPGARERLDAARATGAHVAITSDMHLGAEFLGPRLRALGLLNTSDALLISSDVGVSKAADGRLFERLRPLVGGDATARTRRIVHVGNDPWADYAMARRRGLRAVLDRSAALNRYEAALAAAPDPTGLAGLLAGASRIVRLRHPEVDPTVAGVVCGVAAPTLAAFAVWIGESARRLDLDDLVFLSRNGRLPYEMFARLGDAVTGGLEPRYLRLSRDAVRLPSAAAVGLDRWLDVGQSGPEAFLCEFDDRMPLARIVERLGLAPAEQAETLARHGLDPMRPLALQDRTRWAGVLAEPAIRDRLRLDAAESLRDLADYLESHDVGTGTGRIGLVDIGWTGQQAAMITACLHAGSGIDADRVHHFHLGRRRSVPLVVPTHVQRFLFDIVDTPVDNPVGLYELFTATSEPGMAGVHRRSVGSVEPDLRHRSAGARQTALVEPLHRLVGEFADELRRDLHSSHLQAELHDVLRSLARMLWFRPTVAEGRALGALPWEVDSSGHVVRSFAEPVRGSELVDVLRTGKLAGRQWSVGAAAGAAWPIRTLLTPLVRWKAHRRLDRSVREATAASAAIGAERRPEGLNAPTAGSR